MRPLISGEWLTTVTKGFADSLNYSCSTTVLLIASDPRLADSKSQTQTFDYACAKEVTIPTVGGAQAGSIQSQVSSIQLR